MRILIVLVVLLAIAANGVTLLVTQPWEGPGTASYIVVTERGSSFSVTFDLEFTDVFSLAISGFAAELTDDEAKELAAQPGVTVEKDIEFHILDIPPTGVDRIDAEKWWPQGRGAGVTVAIIDTGIDLNHPDLEFNAALSKDFTGEGLDDCHGHGSHVSGTVAARDGNGGVVGVAPEASLVALKVLKCNGSGSFSGILAALDYAILHADEIDVINMSLGASAFDNTTCGGSPSGFHKAICNTVAAGIVVVVAAGNDNQDARLTIPATYEEVLTVSAVVDSDGEPGGRGPATSRGPDDSLASFSNWGEDVDLAAPGVDIRSAWMGGGYKTISGTSMASPHVAGLAALWIEKNGKPQDAAGVLAVHEGLKDWASAQASECGFTGDRDAFAERMAMAVPCGDSGPGPEPTPTPAITPTATPQPGEPPSGLRARTECPSGEVNVIISWGDTSNESWYGVWVDDDWRGLVEQNATRFLWGMGQEGESHVASVAANVNQGYVFSEPLDFTIACPGDNPTATPVPTPIPTPTLRELFCEIGARLELDWCP